MKRFIALLLCCTFIFAPTALAAEEPDTERAVAAYIYEATTGTVLYEKNADGEIIPASMTKILTAIVVMENEPDLSRMVTVTQEDLDATYAMSETICLLVGEKISIRELLEFMIIVSDNEACLVLAKNVGGTVDAFVEMMNETAARLGCSNTHYTDPQGAGTYNHHTTARDVVIMLSYAMQFDIFREIVGLEQNTLPPSNVRTRVLLYESTNRVKWPRGDAVYENQHSEYVVGGKSGSLFVAGNSYACLTERDGMEIYTVVAQGDSEIIDGVTYKDCYRYTINLLDYAINYAVTSVSNLKEVASVPLEGGGEVSVTAAAPCGFVYEHGGQAGTVTLDLPDSLPADVQAGAVVGTATVERQGETKTVDLIVMDEAPHSIAVEREPLEAVDGEPSTEPSGEPVAEPTDKPTAFPWIYVVIGAAVVAAIVVCVIVIGVSKKKKAQ